MAGRNSLPILPLLVACMVTGAPAEGPAGDALQRHRETLRRFVETGLREDNAYRMLQVLTRRAPHRLSGSAGADTAVRVARELLASAGADSVWTEPCMVPHWERGPAESALVTPSSRRDTPFPLAICALGGSVATPPRGVRAEVVEVRSFDELRALGPRARGRIVFFNRPMDPGLLNTFEA